MILRDPKRAGQRDFDLVIIGGGIYGVSLLQEAARRGVSACLCEAADFGGGTSWNSLRIVHGGLRYLQTMDLRRFFQSVSARHRIAKQFPALVRPLECVMPLYQRGLKRVSVARVALRASDLLSAGRNHGLSPSVHLPGSGVLDSESTLRRFPTIRREGLEGAARWSDYFMISSERILIELLRDACSHGAAALNYAPVLEVLRENGVAKGVRIRDALSGEVYTIAARAVVNSAGPHVRSVAREAGSDVELLFRPSLAFNVMLDVVLPDSAALAVAPPRADGPILFLVPHRQHVLAGTLHVPRSPDTTEPRPTEAELQEFLTLLNQALPGLGVGIGHVRRVFAGLLPVTIANGINLVKRELLHDHGKAGGLRQFYSLTGVKFTTANEVARRVLALMGHPKPSRDAEHLQLAPGTDVLTDAGRLWSESDGTLSAVLRRVVEEEAVQSLDDLVFRRSNWASTENDIARVRVRASQLITLPPVPPRLLDLAAARA